MPSTVVSSMKYDPVKAILRIVFVSGMEYDYLNVPVDVYNSLRASKSKGIFLNKFIKGNYSFRKIR